MRRHLSNRETFGRPSWLGQETGQNRVVDVGRGLSIANDDRNGNSSGDESGVCD
jgi:hypothetical protein